MGRRGKRARRKAPTAGRPGEARGRRDGRVAGRRAAAVEAQTAPASFGRRIAAFLVDWYVGALATALPIAAIAEALGRGMTDQAIAGYPVPYGLVAGVLGLAAGVAYYALAPMALGGQTLGKRLFGLRIVRTDGAPAGPGALLLRQAVGLIVLEQAAVGTSAVLQQVCGMLTGPVVAVAMMWAGLALTIASLVLCGCRRDRRALHDLLAGTVVVDARAAYSAADDRNAMSSS